MYRCPICGGYSLSYRREYYYGATRGIQACSSCGFTNRYSSSGMSISNTSIIDPNPNYIMSMSTIRTK